MSRAVAMSASLHVEIRGDGPDVVPQGAAVLGWSLGGMVALAVRPHPPQREGKTA